MLSSLDLWQTNRSNLEQKLKKLGYSTSHAKSIFRFLYKENSLSPWKAPQLPAALRKQLFAEEPLNLPKIAYQHISAYDDSVKFGLKLHDQSLIEMVLMPEKTRLTLCLSSQVGCQRNCSFCTTGKMGLKRNLKTSELVSQVLLANRWIKENPKWNSKNINKSLKVSHLVFMGMGEPLDNLEALITALEIFADPLAFAFSYRRLTVSTVGHIKNLKFLLEHGPKVSIAISLHAASSRLRSQLMPINKRYPLEELIACLEEKFPLSGNREVLIQYIVIDRINDSSEEAYKLIELLKNIKVKLNLIPFNSFLTSKFKAPEPEQLKNLSQILLKNKIRTMIRFSKGQDINAACGQLLIKKQSRV